MSQNDVLKYVAAKLAADKVDACTEQIRSCLTSENACGEDYSGCIGLDTETIADLCPVDKLTACADKHDSNTARDYVNKIAMGLSLQIDNNMLTTCQKALDDSMMKVCGDTQTCDALAKDEKLGARSLKYQVCEIKINDGKNIEWTGNCKQSLDAISQAELKEKSWAGKVTGLLHWGNISYNYETNKFTSPDEYLAMLKTQYSDFTTDEEKETYNTFTAEINQLESSIKAAMDAIEADPKVKYCMTGRSVQTTSGGTMGTGKSGGKGTGARFPNLTDQTKKIIIAYALKAAREKYQEKYDEEIERLMKDQVAAAEKVDHEAAVQVAKNACETWATNSVLPRSKTPVSVLKWIGLGLVLAASAVAAVFTFGAAAAVAGVVAANAVGATMVAGAAAGVAAGIAQDVQGAQHASVAEVGHATLDQWNYKATITTMFNESSGECTKETIYQNCAKERLSSCKHWEDEKTKTQTIKLM